MNRTELPGIDETVGRYIRLKRNRSKEEFKIWGKGKYKMYLSDIDIFPHSLRVRLMPEEEVSGRGYVHILSGTLTWTEMQERFELAIPSIARFLIMARAAKHGTVMYKLEGTKSLKMRRRNVFYYYYELYIHDKV